MKERKRVSPEDVRNNARNAGGGMNWFTLPDGISVWTPEKAGKYALDFLPYEVKSENHPDKVEKEALWWKHPFFIHYRVGVNKESVVCPRTVGLPCPMCQEKDRLAANWDKNEAAIRAIKPQKWWAFKIKHPDDQEKIAVFAISEGKFYDYQGGGLAKEIDEGDEKNLLFYELIKGWGRTVTVRFSEEVFEKSTFLKASRFDFSPRPDMEDDADDLIDALCLDDIFGNILPYDKLKALFLDTPNGQAAAKAGGEPEARQEPRKRGAPEQEPEPEEKDEPEGPEFKPGDRVQADEGGEPGTVTRVKGTQIRWKTDGGKDMVSEADDLHLFKGKSSPLDGPKGGKAPKWKEGDRVTFDNDGEPFEGTIVEIDGEDCTVEADDGEEADCKLADLRKAGGKEAPKTPPKEDAPLPARGALATIAVGDTVKDEDGVVGKVTKIKGTEATYQDAGGTKYVEDVDDLTKVAEDAPAGKKDTAPAELKAGDKVKWDDGMEEGEVIKVKDGKAKVKNEDGETVTLPLAQLTKK